MAYLMHWNEHTQQYEHEHPKRELTVYIPRQRPFDGEEEDWTPVQYIPPIHTRGEYSRAEAMPAEESAEEKWYIDLTTVLVQISSTLFFGFLKCFLFFLEAYPKNLKEVQEEERLKRERTVTSLPRQGVPRLVRQNDTK